jgi:hypothetical protein
MSTVERIVAPALSTSITEFTHVNFVQPNGETVQGRLQLVYPSGHEKPEDFSESRAFKVCVRTTKVAG